MNKKIRANGRRKESESLAAVGLKGLAGLTVAAAGGWILYSNLAIDHQMPLDEAIPADRAVFDSPQAGAVSYYSQRRAEGRPLVLVHSVNAAASAYEVRPLFLHYRSRRPVYALDLPGYGFSSRENRHYSPELYQDSIAEFLREVVGEPADVVALSLSSEFAARAALAEPDLFASLALVSPTGFGPDQNSQKKSTNPYPVLSFPLWGRPLFDLIATRASIEYFLAKSFLGPVPGEMIEYAYATAHQPGAEHAPLRFISGNLFTLGVREQVYDRLRVPTLVLYDRDNFVSFDMLPATLSASDFVQAVRLVPSLGLPQFEHLEDMVEVLNRFWS
jgi:pimeloyl-ACP methyl ester carboxylesterase